MAPELNALHVEAYKYFFKNTHAEDINRSCIKIKALAGKENSYAEEVS